ncbi:(2Fe-2S)-binding protein [Marinobacter sp.]|uniref:(2Fe-2S)-binding protein n=1 Tax=Marinobacter sp. TaxID=50741 RepID=UPI0019C2120E|nr:(2Fe-2S)-binding protein [Marinobacter sp.]MBC7193474.1 (2Fe-2S)-binding protein [Marinobacter sp.]
MRCDPRETWPQRYRAMLAGHQLDAGQVLGDSLQTPDLNRPALFSLAQALENPELLRQQIAEDYREVAGQDPVARLSVLQLNLMISVISPLTLQLFRNGASPLPDPKRIYLAAIDKAQPRDYRWFLAPGTEAKGAPDFTEEAARQLEHWYRVFRQALGVSPGAFWSSAALALGAPFSAVWNRAGAAEVCAMASEWLMEFNCPAHRYMEWLPAGEGPGKVAIPQRRGCCLDYRLPGGRYCGTCGVHRKKRLAALRQARPQVSR